MDGWKTGSGGGDLMLASRRIARSADQKEAEMTRCGEKKESRELQEDGRMK